MSGKAQHVIPNGRKWSVRRTDAERASRVFATQEAALGEAKRLAANQAVTIYVHGRDGRIAQRIPFRPDLFSYKD